MNVNEMTDIAMKLSRVYSKTYTNRVKQWLAVAEKARELLAPPLRQDVPSENTIRQEMHNQVKELFPQSNQTFIGYGIADKCARAVHRRAVCPLL